MATGRKTKTSRPADAIKALQKTLEDSRIQVRRKHVATDLADLHLSFPSDEVFTGAVLAVVRQILTALRDPRKYGQRLSGKLSKLRRAAFPALGSADASLRLVIEPLPGGAMRVYAFRHRHHPPRLYAVVEERSKSK